ncbi:hypothetical protein HMPREF9446_03982 [Bacteroides fluxus YIT 12057]|uniref:Uncharacterized protein n=1 Tax=Bacteroides fluxus YIT 12057 TaxID=763034 RepID=F3PYS6_9BACE|nr:hypothetical protein HMPREF9446_03982 [Bacteroides fluxus YIT 12057]
MKDKKTGTPVAYIVMQDNIYCYGGYIYWRFLYKFIPSRPECQISLWLSQVLYQQGHFTRSEATAVAVIAHGSQLGLQRLVQPDPGRKGTDGVGHTVSRVVKHGKLFLRVGADMEGTEVFFFRFSLFFFCFHDCYMINYSIKIVIISAIS